VNNAAGQWAPPPIKIFFQVFSHFFTSRFAERRALGKEAFADRIFAEDALPRAALGKGFAESLRGFAESLGPSAKQPAPVLNPYSLEEVCIIMHMDGISLLGFTSCQVPQMKGKNINRTSDLYPVCAQKGSYSQQVADHQKKKGPINL
jgi:hypothetical protein